ncbi:Pimeloyl-ACP methyl ester carboxylesterase [Actinacidiphila alni]|uniref:Pimeloyl-ACP methyl ester carboxylesterase n=1 Tax=Actinacidiphila alni TaxID=380248 RepID=A0A1I2MT44_9ACTN|nr:alpha/beta hydrolase [Actinacidiphila alni]SFF94704.1 Pimeloyl-ACP methyl ester carboxylesterase [Actinacidiphila alni]
MHLPSAPPDRPTGRGSVGRVPRLPAGFTDTFTSRYVDVDGLRLHAVTGGEGPPLLLLAGWPQTWYAWRLVMPALAREFRVVAVDARGVGLSDKPATGYDTGTLARDMAGLMTALGHGTFAVVGHDIGMWTGYALAADHGERVERLAVAEAAVPGLTPSPPLFSAAEVNDRLWHFAFNRLGGINEKLVEGREHLFFGHQFTAKAARPLPDHAVQHYVDTLAADPAALRASFAFYRSLDETIAQNEQRAARRLTLPVLAVGGAQNLGAAVAATMDRAADDVTGVVIPGCGHFPPEETPQELLSALRPFLAPYRDQAVHPPRIAAATVLGDSD